VVVGFTLEAFGGWTPSLLSIAACYLLAAGCWLLVDPERPIDGC
jgi:hypothetical protein